jgi:hypothetical protein
MDDRNIAPMVQVYRRIRSQVDAGVLSVCIFESRMFQMKISNNQSRLRPNICIRLAGICR